MEKQTRTINNEDWSTREVEVFVETITETRNIEFSIDSIESQITQKQNLVDNTILEIQALQRKLNEINAFNNI